jgi:hypothetical protein
MLVLWPLSTDIDGPISFREREREVFVDISCVFLYSKKS